MTCSSSPPSLAALFVFAEHRVRRPLRLSILRRPSFSGAFVAFAAYFGIFSIFFFTALYLQVVIGYSGLSHRDSRVQRRWPLAMILASVLGWTGGSAESMARVPDDQRLPRCRLLGILVHRYQS